MKKSSALRLFPLILSHLQRTKIKRSSLQQDPFLVAE